ncbi:MAG: TRAP transporter small permease [Peptococcaceae bacterium]|nr:TRAP transporter small permease [Peptococcaceae bacterium]
MNPVANFTFKFSRFLDRIAGWAIVATMVAVVGNVVLRVFGHPLGGTYEWVGFLTALAVGLSLAYCAAMGGHVAITFFMDKLTPKAQAYVDIATGVIVLLFLLLATREITAYATSMVVSGEVAATTKVPIYPFIYLIAFGFVAYVLVMLNVILESIGKVAKK